MESNKRIRPSDSVADNKVEASSIVIAEVGSVPMSYSRLENLKGPLLPFYEFWLKGRYSSVYDGNLYASRDLWKKFNQATSYLQIFLTSTDKNVMKTITPFATASPLEVKDYEMKFKIIAKRICEEAATRLGLSIDFTCHQLNESVRCAKVASSVGNTHSMSTFFKATLSTVATAVGLN